MEKIKTYNYKVQLRDMEEDGKLVAEYNDVTVEFSTNENDYGNGTYMHVRKCGFAPNDVFDCRYDTRLKLSKLGDFFPVFMKGLEDNYYREGITVTVQ